MTHTIAVLPQVKQVPVTPTQATQLEGKVSEYVSTYPLAPPPNPCHLPSYALPLTTPQTGFYVALTLIPLSVLTYYAASSNTIDPMKIPVITNLISAYRDSEERTNRRAILNEAAVEQAASDRHLFTTHEQERMGPELEFPE